MGKSSINGPSIPWLFQITRGYLVLICFDPHLRPKPLISPRQSQDTRDAVLMPKILTCPGAAMVMCYGSSYHSLEPRIIQMVSAKIEPVNWPATVVSVGRTHHVDVRFPKSRILFIHCPWFRWPTSAWDNRVFLAKLLSGSIFSTYPKIIKNHGYRPFFASVGSSHADQTIDHGTDQIFHGQWVSASHQWEALSTESAKSWPLK